MSKMVFTGCYFVVLRYHIGFLGHNLGVFGVQTIIIIYHKEHFHAINPLHSIEEILVMKTVSI